MTAFPSIEERLLVPLTFSSTTAGEEEEIRALAGRVTSWETLHALAAENATEPLVQRNLEAVGLFETLPEEIRAKFQDRSDRIREANEARLEGARPLFAKFAERNVPVVVLKGILFAETIYRNPYYKKMNDVDILIRREDLDTVYDIYEELDYFSMGELLGDKPRKQEKFSHHTPPFFNRKLTIMVGTHWGLITPLAPYKLDYEAIWNRVEKFDFYGNPALAMSPEDNLHHLCVHLPYYKTGLRELADIYNVIRHTGPKLDWDLFLREIRKAGTENLVYHALGLADRICPSREAGEILRQIEPRVSRYYRKDTLRKTRSLSLLLRSRCVHLSRIEKAFTDLNATKKAGEQWDAFRRMHGNLWFTPGPDVAKMNSIEKPTFLARLATPGRIRKVFYRDVGRLLFWVLMLKTALEVFGSILSSPFQKGERPNYETYAGKLGLTVADLERLKEALE